MTPLTSRRAFIKRMGLGAGAVLLAPIARTLIAEAQGMEVSRKRVIFFLTGQGLKRSAGYVPAPFAEQPLTSELLPGAVEFEWPLPFSGLAEYRDRALIIDGLSNQVPRGQHTGGYSALSCVSAANDGSNEDGDLPGAQTVDQYLADVIGGNSAHPSLLFGLTGNGSTQVCFARDKEKPAPFIVDPIKLHQSLFADIAPVGAGEGKDLAAVRRRLLLDSLREDVKRLQRELAGPEREKLEMYLALVEDYDRRQSSLPALSCSAPAAPHEGAGAADKLQAMMNMATVALGCGMTQVVGIGMGVGHGHGGFFPRFEGLATGTAYEHLFENGHVGGPGHDGDEKLAAQAALVGGLCSGMLAELLRQLQTIPENGGNAFDNTVLVWISDNGDNHHSAHRLYPTLVIGSAGGKIKADGRYLRYGRAKNEHPPWRGLGDLWNTICTAVGAPTDHFGRGNPRTAPYITGSLEEIVA